MFLTCRLINSSFALRLKITYKTYLISANPQMDGDKGIDLRQMFTAGNRMLHLYK